MTLFKVWFMQYFDLFRIRFRQVSHLYKEIYESNVYILKCCEGLAWTLSKENNFSYLILIL